MSNPGQIKFKTFLTEGGPPESQPQARRSEKAKEKNDHTVKKGGSPFAMSKAFERGHQRFVEQPVWVPTPLGNGSPKKVAHSLHLFLYDPNPLKTKDTVFHQVTNRRKLLGWKTIINVRLRSPELPFFFWDYLIIDQVTLVFTTNWVQSPCFTAPACRDKASLLIYYSGCSCPLHETGEKRNLLLHQLHHQSFRNFNWLPPMGILLTIGIEVEIGFKPNTRASPQNASGDRKLKLMVTNCEQNLLDQATRGEQWVHLDKKQRSEPSTREPGGRGAGKIHLHIGFRSLSWSRSNQEMNK